MNFKFVVLCALALLTGSAVYGQDNVIDEVVWVVGDEAILKSEVEEARMSAQYEGRKFDGDPYCVIPEEIAVQKLYLHQAALDSIEKYAVFWGIFLRTFVFLPNTKRMSFLITRRVCPV